jgi:Uma2 family endonuclease
MRTDDYLSGPEELRRRELVWGVVREPPSPFASHQRVTARITALLDCHVRQHDLGTVLAAPMDVVLDHERELVVQPDVMFISHARAGIIRDFVRGAPDLVVEVSSRGTERYDRTDKVRWYRACGVREYWLVDPLQGRVSVLDLSPGGSRLTVRGDQGIRSGVLPLFAHTAAELLASLG